MEKSPSTASFTIKKSTLDNLFKLIKASKSRTRTCELTLTDNKATFVARDVNFSIPVLSLGAGKATFELSTFTKVIKTYDKEELQIEIHPDYVKVENFKMPVF